MKKKARDIIILSMCTTNYDQMMYSSWDMVLERRVDGQGKKSDRQKKRHIEVGVPPKNKVYRKYKSNKYNVAMDPWY